MASWREFPQINASALNPSHTLGLVSNKKIAQV